MAATPHRKLQMDGSTIINISTGTDETAFRQLNRQSPDSVASQGTPRILVDLSLVSLGCSPDSESCPNSAGSPGSENAENFRSESPSDRPMSPQNGFKLRLSKEERQNSECTLSGVPTVVQTSRRILVPRSHSSPLLPMRLFSPIVPDKAEVTSSSPQDADPHGSRRMFPRVMTRHLRQQKRDELDHPGRKQQEEDSEDDACLADGDDDMSVARGSSSRRSSLEMRNVRQYSRSTFRSDFFNFVQIGKGTYGNVFRCVRKLDMRSYAVKEITSPFRSKRERERALKEIYALATQGDNIHVVRYYSAWEENDKLYILTELCSGTLAQARKSNGPLSEAVLQEVLSQIAHGLAYLHSRWNIAHLDIKPENLYTTDRGIYKLGDLGLASLGDRKDAAEEGDKRYLSREMLQRSDCDLYKVDMFALGVSMYELASPYPLPANGDEYHALRDGAAPRLVGISQPLQDLVYALMLPEPLARPSAQELCQHTLLVPSSFPCLLNPDINCEKDVNVLSILSDSKLLEWARGRARWLEKESESLSAELLSVTKDAKRFEAEVVARKRRAPS